MSEIHTKAWLELANELAVTAQLIAKREMGTVETGYKTDGSEVTATDLRIQRLVADRIRHAFPDHALLGEEDIGAGCGLPDPSAARYCWVVDPIDGTRNFVRKLPHYCTSIGLLDNGVPIVGVVREHVTGVTYAARRGAGATANGCPIQASDAPLCPRSIVAFQADNDGEAYAPANELLRMTRLRNFGSTAMHLAFLAAGAIDGVVCVQARVWDVAAGVLLVTEAGGVITSPSGGSLFPYDYSGHPSRLVPFIAGTQQAHGKLLAYKPLQQFGA